MKIKNHISKFRPRVICSRDTEFALKLLDVYKCVIGVLWILALCTSSTAQNNNPVETQSPPAKPAKIVYGATTGFPPYEYLDAQGQPTGFNVELARELAKETGVQLEIRSATWTQLVKEFEAGKIDFISLAYSDSRANKYYFYPTIWTLRTALLFPDDRQSYPNRLDQLSAETVAVQDSTLAHEILRELPESQRPALRTVSTLDEAVKLLEKGQVTVVISYELALRRVADEAKTPLTIIPVKSVSFHFVTQKDRKSQLPDMELAMENIRRSGKFDQLVERYLVASTESNSWRDYALYFLILVAVLTLIALGVILWNRSLQRVVYARTRDLAASEARVSSIVETAADAIITINNKGKIESVNAAAASIFGYEPKEIIGGNICTLIPSLQNSECSDSSALAINESDTFPSRRYIDGRHENGKTFPIELSISIMSLGDQKTFTLIARDMTEQKQLEEQLRQAQKMEAVGRLAGGIAHDFNNLLTGVMGYTSILMMRIGKDSPHLKQLGEIKKACERTSSLTKQLLAFSRKQVLTPKVINLNNVIKDFEPMLSPLIGEHIELVTRLDNSLCMIKADPNQLEQLIMNLAVNARDAMPKGGILTISTINAEVENHSVTNGFASHQIISKHDNYVMLTVSDTGQGMDEETKQHLFEPFYTTKALGRGTGLGLATVYGIVEQNGGHIKVNSELNLGTLFNVYFPSVTGEEDARQKPVLTEEMPRGKGTILLVEDEDMVRNFAAETLRMCGYNVFTAANGREALNVYDKHREAIQLLITDVVMPEMSGRELVEQLPVMHPLIKVLFISGYTDDALIHHRIFEQRTAFLNKPFNSVTLTHAVRELLDEVSSAKADYH